MDEKTESLRDLFLSVAGDTTVTEQQEASRGSLTSKTGVRKRLTAIIDKMRERYAFTTELPDAKLATLVEAYYDDAADEDIATMLDVTPATVFDARMDLHLVRDSDLDADIDLDALRSALADDTPVTTIAADLDTDDATIRRATRVIKTQAERRRVSDRFVTDFEEILDAISTSMTKSTRETGLKDATEGMESNVSF
ncbi:conditioned medium-induced protein 4 [Haladaptatus sp. DJG-WS-42]|uniref:conditioned medium-induced protein 4 n=1 Tax=Haladaptatus sp. DJG-WS-42 TaxID=3120516 RepID=UPI0030D49BB3